MALSNRTLDELVDEDAYTLRDGELEYGDDPDDEECDDGIDLEKLGRVMQEKTEASRKVRVDLDLSAAEEPKGAGVHWLQMRRVRTDGGTQSRVRLDPIIVQDYAEQFSRNATITTKTLGISSEQLWWGDFPPVEVYLDGDYWLVDGFHRLAGLDQALARAGMPVESRRNWRIQCRVFLGSKRDAILQSVGANSRHGLRRTNADKRKSVETLLRDEEWRQWADAEIARRCAVDPKTVGNIRHMLELNREIPDTLIRKRADGATVDTTNVGANQVKPVPVRNAPVYELEAMVRAWLSGRTMSDADMVLDTIRTGQSDYHYDSLAKHLEKIAYQKPDLLQAINNVREQRRQAALQAKARTVYVEPEPKPEPEVGPKSNLAHDELEVHPMNSWVALPNEPTVSIDQLHAEQDRLLDAIVEKVAAAQPEPEPRLEGYRPAQIDETGDVWPESIKSISLRSGLLDKLLRCVQRSSLLFLSPAEHEELKQLLEKAVSA